MSLAEVPVSTPVLSLRELGESELTLHHARAVLDAAAVLPVDAAPVISFDGIASCDELFVQSAIVRSVSEAWYRRGHVAAVEGAKPSVLRVVGPVLQSNAVVVWCEDGRRWRLLGASKLLAQSLAAARDAGVFSLSEFAARLLVSETAAENRLAMLRRLGAVTRYGVGWRVL
jgi:hypothetical protein